MRWVATFIKNSRNNAIKFFTHKSYLFYPLTASCKSKEKHISVFFVLQTVQMLKQTCTMLEGQVEELEVMNDEYQDREATWNLIK